MSHASFGLAAGLCAVIETQAALAGVLPLRRVRAAEFYPVIETRAALAGVLLRPPAATAGRALRRD